MRIETLPSDGCLGYLLASGSEAAIVDPTRDTRKYLERLAREGLALRFVIDTHTHADHLSGARKLADETGARLVMSARFTDQWRAAEGKADALGIGDVLRANAGVKVDHGVKDGEALELGGEAIEFLESPGHTTDSLVVIAGPRALTGDTLLIGQTGRCDLPGGDGSALHQTLFERLARLPDEIFVYPGHDYQGQTVTALGYERRKNPFFQPRSSDEFVRYLAGAFPTLTGAGMQCGASTAGSASCATGSAPADPWRERVSGYMGSWFFSARRDDAVVSSQALWDELSSGAPVYLLDVREPGEFESGHVEGAHNLSVRDLDTRLGEIESRKDARIVAICRSGHRSGWATMFLRVAGFRDVRSLTGGMLDWSALKLPVRTGSGS